MTTSVPVCVDDATEVINAFVAALRKAFDPASSCPPDGGGTGNVRFLACDGAPQAAWNAHSAEDSECSEPFVWVRVAQRYRSAKFPDPVININPCDLPRVIAIEVGVARCALMALEPKWEQYAAEADVSLDDSWRLESALCAAMKGLVKKGHLVGTDILMPFGPDGGVLGWSAQAYVQF